MAYLDDLLKGSTKTINNFDSLGGYSPLYGFSNEDELAKNPYQQILSSASKEQTYKPSNPLNSGWLENRNMFNSNGNSFQIPDGINIDSTFYNRKDIYDLKQRLKASGVEMPETKKDKPGIITRALDILSTPGYAMTTMLYNAFDGKKDTKALKGLLDGVIGGLTSNSDKYKEGSDLVDLMVGEQKKDAGIGEKVGRFAGGMALDVLLDPTTYLTFGTGAFLKGATKQVGEEVTEEAVKKAIKDVNGIGDIGKVGTYLDLDDQAKRITKKINDNAVKHRDGFRLYMPFIHKEIISAEKISEIGKKLGVQDTLGKGLNKVESTTKGIWNYKKSEDGIRTSLEAIPENIKRKFDTNYDLKKDMVQNPLKASRDIASKEVEKVKLGFGKSKVLEESYEGVKELITLMKEAGINSEEASSLMEKLETHNTTKEFDPDAIIKMIQEKYLDNVNRGLESATKGAKQSEIEMRKRMVELLQGKLVEFKETEQLQHFFKNNGIDVEGKSLDEQKALVEEINKSKIPTPEELGIIDEKPMTLDEKINDIRTKNNYETDWEIYADSSKKDIEEFINSTGMSKKDFDNYLELSRKEKDKVIDDLLDKRLNELVYTNEKGQKVRNREKANKVRDEISELRNKFDNINKLYKQEKADFIKANTTEYKPYKTATTFEELDNMVDEMINEKSQKVINKANEFDKRNNDILGKTPEEIYNESNLVDMSKLNVRKEAEELANNYFGNGKLSKDVETSKRYFIEAYEKAFKEGKVDVKKPMIEIWNNLHRSKIREQTINMLTLKDNILLETGLKGVKGAEQFLDKLIENKVQNMLKPKSMYFVSPYKSITNKSLKKEFLKYFNGKNVNNVKIPNFTSFTDIAHRLNDYENFMNGTSKYFEGNMQKLFGLRSNYNSSVEGKLRTEAVTQLKNIMHGRGIDSSSSDLFDEAIRFRSKHSGAEMNLQTALENLNKGRKKENSVRKKIGLPPLDPYTYDTLPKSFFNDWEQISEGGVLQRLTEQIRKEFRENYKGVSFYNLPKEERQALLKKVNKMVEDITDSEYFSGNYDVLTGQNITNYSDTLKRSEQVYDNYNGKPLRNKTTYSPQEYLNATSEASNLSKEIDEALKGDNGIRSMPNTIEKGGKLEDLKLRAEEDLELMKEVLKSDDLGYQDTNKLNRLIKQREKDIEAINKEINIYLDMIGDSNKQGAISKVGTYATDEARNTVVNTKSWTEKGQTVNLTKTLDEAPTKKFSSQTRDDKIKALQEEYAKARQRYLNNSQHNTAEMEFAIDKSLPDGVKMEKIVGNEGNVQKVMDNVNNRNIGKMNVKELRQMLTDAGVKGISNAKREKLVEIANLINSKNIRASIDLTKKTPEEMMSLLKSLGIKDEQFNEAVKRFTGYKADVHKFQATKDAIKGAWNDKNIEKFTNTMEYLYGDGFVEKWNHDIDVLKTKKENFVKTGMVAKSPIELIESNKEIIDALGGGEKAEEFVQKYVKLMSDFGQDEISWGIFAGDEQLIKSQGYVARRMSDETREILNADVDKNNFLEAWFRDRANMIVDDPKFAKHRIEGYDGKKTIAEINEAIYEATKKKFGEDGAIKNFFEKDLSRILIQRAYEHGNAFYDKNLQSMYLDKMGVKLNWAKGKDGSSYNIVENVNGGNWVKTLED